MDEMTLDYMTLCGDIINKLTSRNETLYRPCANRLDEAILWYRVFNANTSLAIRWIETGIVNPSVAVSLQVKGFLPED